MDHKFNLFYLIRSKFPEFGVLGIVEFDKVMEGHNGEYPSLIFVTVVGRSLGIPQMFWRAERITQAEYETYRDLHQFHVITSPGTKR